MTDAGDKEPESKGQRQVAPPVREDEKPSVRDYKSEDKNEMAKTKIEYTEVTPKEEERKAKREK